jgi:hypothetical protein
MRADLRRRAASAAAAAVVVVGLILVAVHNSKTRVRAHGDSTSWVVLQTTPCSSSSSR